VEKARAQGRDTNEELDELMEAIPVGILRMDARGHCAYVNERWSRLAGLTWGEASRYGWIRALHADDRKRVLRGWRKAARERREFADEFRFRKYGEGVRTVSARGQPILSASGEVDGYIAAFTDITEHQRVEESLRDLATDLGKRAKELNCLFGISHIVEHSGGSLDQILRETVALLPPSWRYPDITCARIVMDDLELTTDNYQASPWRQTADIVVHEERAGMVEVSYLEERPRRDEGPFSADERSLINAVAVLLGRIAERLRAEQQVIQREQELRERLTHITRVSVMGEMASSIAHEVSQPLTAISTYAQACRRMVDDGALDSTEVQDILTRISDEAIRAGGMIHGLRDLVQKRESKRTDCDINMLVRDVERLASIDARLHDARLRFELADSLPPACVDGIQIQQVILNLIRNGIDALSDTGMELREVVLRTTALTDCEIQVSVTDYGSGLSPDVEDRLFEPFLTTKEGGLGMGLSISQSIVNSHGGRIWFARNPEGGTTFFFTLPASAGSDVET
jgi:PAS domain S-box-containing protein